MDDDDLVFLYRATKEKSMLETLEERLEHKLKWVKERLK